MESIRQNFETNLFALIALTQLVIPIMRKQGKGRIVNVGSVAGRIARPFSSVYDATKHALEAVTDGLRGEMSPFGIRVSLIQPGFILTEFLEVANTVSKPVIEHAGPYAPYLGGFAGMSEKARRIAGRYCTARLARSDGQAAALPLCCATACEAIPGDEALLAGVAV